MRKTPFTWTLSLAMAFAVVACSKGGDAKPEGPATKKAAKPAEKKVAPTAKKAAEPAVKAEEKPAAPAGATVVALASNDAMQFDKKEIKVPAGKKVQLTLTHTGKMAKEVMGHNFVLLKAGVDMAAFATAAMTAKATDFIPEAKKGDVVASTKVIGGGESVTITFDAPAAGTYQFLCTFPGHYAVMNGKFIVE